MIVFEKGQRTNINPLYKKLRKVWEGMMDRCYKKEHRAYKNYGAKGVGVSVEWQTLNGFLESVDKVDGWNQELFLQGLITLDKDHKDRNNKLYSCDMCKFITLEENNKVKPNQQREVIGISPNGEKYNFFNQSEFARENSLRQSTIGDCLNGKVKFHKGWQFKYAD